MTDNRRLTSRRVREDAAAMAYDRSHPQHLANGDEQRLASACYAMSFTKGLDHDPATGLVASNDHFLAFRSAIDKGFAEAFTNAVPVPQAAPRRQWEAPTAGTTYELEGPDPQAVTMPPAPRLGTDELAFEMAEVYELALLRDVPFNRFDSGGGSGKLTASIGRLNALDYAKAGFPGRPRKTDTSGALDRQTVFRGSGPGTEFGPYLSQFLLIGTALPGEGAATGPSLARGDIAYGAQCIAQQVLTAEAEVDFMQSWDDWLHVQKGYQPTGPSGNQPLSSTKRFIHTPRDLATYVHFDALYQAYLNACLILLAMKTPFDPGFAALSGMGNTFDHNPTTPSIGTKRNAGGFALYGGPHILTLVTEVATRALKAVRYQKFNNHLRLRPEALAGRVHAAEFLGLDAAVPTACGAFGALRDKIGKTVDKVIDLNAARGHANSALLPMAFAEGSPMHPTYGAGHATVAGACVTILKAYFDCGAVLGVNADGSHGFYTDIMPGSGFSYQSKAGGTFIDKDDQACPLTLEGELNKLAANISIGRNMAGVHYFSDYYDSLRMGEQIAIGILEEQALCYGTDPFVMSVPTFDGDLVRIGRR